MKKASILTGIGLIAMALLSFIAEDNCEKPKENRKASIAHAALGQPFGKGLQTVTNPISLSIDEIAYVELEEEIDLGFDTADYLPLGFNAYEGMVFDLNDIAYEELEEEIDLGFDTASHLPKGFNPYQGMDLDLQVALEELDLNSILYIEEEEVIDLGFNSQKYLPKGFDPYAK